MREKTELPSLSSKGSRDLLTTRSRRNLRTDAFASTSPEHRSVLALVDAKTRPPSANRHDEIRMAVVRFAAPHGAQVDAVHVDSSLDIDPSSWPPDRPVPSASSLQFESNPDTVVARAADGTATVIGAHRADYAKPAPLMFDVTALQCEASRLWKWTATETYRVARRLHEAHGLLSTPDSDSRHVPSELVPQLSNIMNLIAPFYLDQPTERLGERTLGRRYVCDVRTRESHAIVPTLRAQHHLPRASHEFRLYDLVARRFLQCWLPDLIQTRLEGAVSVSSMAWHDRYRFCQVFTVRPGWRVLQLPTDVAPESEYQSARLQVGERLRFIDGRTRTAPSSRLAIEESALLHEMSRARGPVGSSRLHRLQSDLERLSPPMRGAVIDELVDGHFLVRSGTTLQITTQGRELLAHSPAFGEGPRRSRTAVRRGIIRSSRFVPERHGYPPDRENAAETSTGSPRRAASPRHLGPHRPARRMASPTRRPGRSA